MKNFDNYQISEQVHMLPRSCAGCDTLEDQLEDRSSAVSSMDDIAYQLDIDENQAEKLARILQKVGLVLVDWDQVTLTTKGIHEAFSWDSEPEWMAAVLTEIKD